MIQFHVRYEDSRRPGTSGTGAWREKGGETLESSPPEAVDTPRGGALVGRTVPLGAESEGLTCNPLHFITSPTLSFLLNSPYRFYFENE